jgi:hypothetical protein
MRTTPLPLVAALAGCVGGTGTTKDTYTPPPMPYYRDTGTVVAPMIPPDSGTTVISPMPPPPMPYYVETADTGTTSGGTGLPSSVAPLPGLSPLPEEAP